MAASHPDLQIVKFTVNVEDGETYDVQVEGVDEVQCSIPESSTYTMTIVFRVLNRTLYDLKYRQDIKKGGFTIKTRNNFVGAEFAPQEEPHVVTFAPDTTPGGFMFRGAFPSVSTYYAGDEELFASDWTLSIVKK